MLVGPWLEVVQDELGQQNPGRLQSLVDGVTFLFVEVFGAGPLKPEGQGSKSTKNQQDWKASGSCDFWCAIQLWSSKTEVDKLSIELLGIHGWLSCWFCLFSIDITAGLRFVSGGCGPVLSLLGLSGFLEMRLQCSCIVHDTATVIRPMLFNNISWTQWLSRQKVLVQHFHKSF